MGLEHPGGLTGVEELAPLLDPVGERLDQLGAGIGQIPDPQPTTAIDPGDQPLPRELGDHPLRPPERGLRRVHHLKLRGGEQSMLIKRLQNLPGDRVKPPRRLRSFRSLPRWVHRLVIPVEKMSARSHRWIADDDAGFRVRPPQRERTSGTPAQRRSEPEIANLAAAWLATVTNRGRGPKPHQERRPGRRSERTRQSRRHAGGYSSEPRRGLQISYQRLTLVLPANADTEQAPQRAAALRPRRECPYRGTDPCIASGAESPRVQFAGIRLP